MIIGLKGSVGFAGTINFDTKFAIYKTLPQSPSIISSVNFGSSKNYLTGYIGTPISNFLVAKTDSNFGFVDFLKIASSQLTVAPTM